MIWLHTDHSLTTGQFLYKTFLSMILSVYQMKETVLNFWPHTDHPLTTGQIFKNKNSFVDDSKRLQDERNRFE